MSLNSGAAVVAQAAAIAVLVLAASQLSAAATAVSPAPVIGLPGCNASCGDVSVPYPFGISPGCYWPGLNLTCDTSGHGKPRLLLGDGTLRVTEISLRNATVRVNRTGSIINTTGDFTSDGWKDSSFGRSFTDYGYVLSYRNELVVSGCNVVATLAGDIGFRQNSSKIISGCATFCTVLDVGSAVAENLDGWGDFDGRVNETSKYKKHCASFLWRCCQAPISISSSPTQVQLRWLSSGNHTKDQLLRPANVFVAEEGWVDQTGIVDAEELEEAPLLLRWTVTKGLTPRDMKSRECPGDVQRRLCKSDNSNCSIHQQGYTCHCKDGYDGNPYLAGAGGCQDINECSKPRQEIPCFGECINKIGTYECRCPVGTQGNSTMPAGCVPAPVPAKSPAGLIIGVSVGSGAGSILLVLVAIFMTQRFKHLRAVKLKQKYFKQNRGQLLQQLVSQKADIAERMIIPVDELAKATNNFDKARELGGGGHGTVYKGILSDQHVVAIKKSKITVQKEIDEFINEVAILSQINHRNVVKLFGCCLETKVPLLVYEFVSNGTLYHHLHVEGPRSLSWANRLRIATETASALAYLHSSISIPIIHRDIKSTNILLDDTLTSKVSDFGASRYIPIDKTGLTTIVQGTIGYLDPLYFYTTRLTEKSDVYSFGVILVELLTRKKPFSNLFSEDGGLVAHFVNLVAEANLVEILDPQVNEEGDEQEIQELAELAASCIKLNSEDRPTMRQVEHKLQGLQASKKYVKDNMWAEEAEDCSTSMNCSSTNEGKNMDESSRRYSMEQELLMSARYPR